MLGKRLDRRAGYNRNYQLVLIDRGLQVSQDRWQALRFYRENNDRLVCRRYGLSGASVILKNAAAVFFIKFLDPFVPGMAGNNLFRWNIAIVDQPRDHSLAHDPASDKSYLSVTHSTCIGIWRSGRFFVRFGH